MNTSDRIKYIRENNYINPGIKQGDFAKSVGTYQVKIADLESGKQKNIPLDLAKKISKEYKINFEWLLTGEGEMLAIHAINIVKIPQRGEVDCAAGNGCIISDENITDYVSFDNKILKELGANISHCEIIRVKGDSMYPTLQTGDKVLVDTSQKEIFDNKIYIIRIDNELKIKRIHKLSSGKVGITSDNPFYQPETLDPEKVDFEICGRVLWSTLLAK